jgi:hypothetical protein
VLISLALAGLVDAQKRDGGKRKIRSNIRETAPARREAQSAPAECPKLVRAIVTYVFRIKPDIATDSSAQNRWLSKSLRQALEHRLQTYSEFVKKEPNPPGGPPGNSDFVGAWDYPTIYSIVGSRVLGDHAVVDVLFTWGPNTQYEGDTRLASYVFVRDSGVWKLDDIYTFRGKFVKAWSLMATFSSNTYP